MARVSLVASLALGLLAAAACQSEAVGVDACRRIESLRCERAPGCGIDLARLGSAADVDGCKRFYRDACQHGLVTRVEPAAVAVDRCEASLREAECAAISDPTLLTDCAWLIPPPPAPVEAGPDGAADAGSEAGSGG